MTANQWKAKVIALSLYLNKSGVPEPRKLHVPEDQPLPLLKDPYFGFTIVTEKGPGIYEV